jgi:GTPase SAR1 family protein
MLSSLCRDFKVIIVGDPSIGKTALMLRFVKDQFGETSTVSVRESVCVSVCV